MLKLLSILLSSASLIGVASAKKIETPAVLQIDTEKSAPSSLKSGTATDTTKKVEDLSSLTHTGAEGFLTQKVDNIETLTRKNFDSMSGLQEDSLAKSMADAYQTNPQIKQQISVVRATVEKTVQAKSGWRPTINGTVSSGLSQSNIMGDSLKQQRNTPGVTKSQKDGSLSAKVELRQNLFAGGQTLNQMKETESAYKAAKSALIDAEQTVLLNVASTYMSLMSKYAEIELLKRNESNLKETLKATQDKYEVGEETRTSVAQADAQLAAGIAQRITAEGELEQLKGTFEKTTFRKPGKLAKPQLPKNMPKTLEETIERARLNAPTLLKAMQDEKTARHAVDRITGALLPSLDLVGSSAASKDHLKSKYTQSNNPGIINPQTNRRVDHSVQLQMTVPLYEAGNTRSQRREASESAEQARIIIEQTRRAIVEQAIAAWNKFKAAEAKIAEFKKQAQANLISLDGTQQELLVGSKILLDVLNAINRLVESQVNLVKAEQDYFAAAYEVMFVMGELTAKSLGLKVDLYDPDIHYRETTNSF
ncbi:MAG: TolC family outer membrane protein [Candidatus Paracaedibacteraceae bacterium]|nr:TolC family outer membrane protein [Candidatus Paracaedibacteraceae bacterium]